MSILRIWQTHISKVDKCTFLWWGLGVGGGQLGFRRAGGRWSRRIFGTFFQVAVFPADPGVCGITPGSFVSIRVPAQIPPEVPVEGENLELQDSSHRYPIRFCFSLCWPVSVVHNMARTTEGQDLTPNWKKLLCTVMADLLYPTDNEHFKILSPHLTDRDFTSYHIF